jgi:hypothetical protein
MRVFVVNPKIVPRHRPVHEAVTLELGLPFGCQPFRLPGAFGAGRPGDVVAGQRIHVVELQVAPVRFTPDDYANARHAAGPPLEIRRH